MSALQPVLCWTCDNRHLPDTDNLVHEWYDACDYGPIPAMRYVVNEVTTQTSRFYLYDTLELALEHAITARDFCDYATLTRTNIQTGFKRVQRWTNSEKSILS